MPFGTDGDHRYLAAHLRDPVDAGGSFWIGESYKYGVTQYKNGFRESTANLATGTEVYLGFSSYGLAGGFAGIGDVSDAGLTWDNAYGGTGSTTIAPDGIVNDGAMDWHRYTVDAQGTMMEFLMEFKDDKDNTYPPLTEWIAYFVLPTGESIAAGTDWDLTDPDNGSDKDLSQGNNPSFQAEAEADIVFSWTIDSKANDGDFDTTPNPNYQNPITQVPEPDTAIYGSLIAALLILRRRHA